MSKLTDVDYQPDVMSDNKPKAKRLKREGIHSQVESVLRKSSPSKEDSPKEDLPKEDSPREESPKEDLPVREDSPVKEGSPSLVDLCSKEASISSSRSSSPGSPVFSVPISKLFEEKVNFDKMNFLQYGKAFLLYCSSSIY